MREEAQERTMAQEPITIGEVVQSHIFRLAQQQADRYPDIESYAAWCARQESTFDRLPDWYRDRADRERNYIAFVQRGLARLQDPAAKVLLMEGSR